MKTTKIIIRNLFGITEKTLDGQSVEISGTNGIGKTSVIDSIRYALTNSSERDYILKKGETEGEIIIETDTGLYINRKKRIGQADYKKITENGMAISSPESFLQGLFTPLQIDPVAFTQMTKQEQNRIILDLIEFDWDLNWIKEQFGEIPQWVNYQQNILQVLSDIQAENGGYFQKRQDINRDIRNKKAFISDIARDIPQGYNADKWEQYDLGGSYKQLEEIRSNNNLIQRAKTFKANYENSLRGLQGEREIAVAAVEREISTERTDLTSLIERMKAEITAAEEKLSMLDEKMKNKVSVIDAEYETKVAKLGNDVEIANKYVDREPGDTSVLEAEISEAEAMKKHLNEYKRMMVLKGELEALEKASEELTEKIQLARNLPGEILKTATIPVDGLTVENGIPLINGLPVSNLSEGEQLDLCVDVALSKPNSLQIILIDGAEKLSDANRERLYAKCKEKGLQFIATRTTNANELEVRYL